MTRMRSLHSKKLLTSEPCPSGPKSLVYECATKCICWTPPCGCENNYATTYSVSWIGSTTHDCGHGTTYPPPIEVTFRPNPGDACVWEGVKVSYSPYRVAWIFLYLSSGDKKWYVDLWIGDESGGCGIYEWATIGEKATEEAPDDGDKAGDYGTNPTGKYKSPGLIPGISGVEVS